MIKPNNSINGIKIIMVMCITEKFDKEIEQRLKVIIVGDPGAGKRDVAKGTDVCVPFKSLGVSIGKKVKMKKKINYKLTLIFWTLTLGRPRTTTYFNGSNAAIIVGNLKDRTSISKMDEWADIIVEQLGSIPLFFIGNYGNKRRTRIKEKLVNLATKYNGNYFLLNPGKTDSLTKIFKSIAEDLAKIYYNLELTKLQT